MDLLVEDLVVVEMKSVDAISPVHQAQILSYVWLHGVKGGRSGCAVTRADVNAIAAEVWKASGKGSNSPQRPAVDVLGWEFALEINETAKEIAAQPEWTQRSRKSPAKCWKRRTR